MNDATARAPWHLWAVGILTLLWNAIGVMSYMMTHLGKLESLGMTPEQIAYFDSFPAWANAVWAIGVWFCLLGSILLLLRSRHAVTAFAISVIGLVGTTYFSYAVTEVPADLQNPLLDIGIWVITLGSLWYAMRQRAAGVLR
jgi:hypothetical protein